MLASFLHSRVAVASAIGTILIFILLGVAHQQDYDLPYFTTNTGHIFEAGSASSPDHAKVRDFFIRDIVGKHPRITQRVYKPWGAFEWKIKGKPKWNEPLGKRLCILDLDSRPFDEDGQLFGSIPLTWEPPESIHGPSLGVLQHWLYAKIHGYEYYYIRTGKLDDRRDSWKKPTIISRVLQKHDTCIFVDSDAIFNHLELPFEWLMNYWKIDKNHTSVTVAIDPDMKMNKDEHGKLYDNTGFIVVQNRPLTYKMMHDWAICADDGGKYPNCTDYRDKSPGHPSDQGGFGNYIRYDPDYKDAIQELPCEEANGFPEYKSECLGLFIKHLWTGKHDLLKIAVGQQVPGRFLEAFYEQMMAEKPKFYLTEEEIMTEEWLAKPLGNS